MKLYDFHCNGCGREFEDLVNEVSDARCPACSSADVAKQLSGFAVGASRGEPAQPPAPCGSCCGGGACGRN
jgi:putative FmdB family regulatory protein